MGATATDYRTQFDKDNLGAWDLKGRDVTLTIARWKTDKVGHDKKKQSRKIFLFFKETQRNGDPIKPFPCNITNAGTIAGMYGNVVEGWVGKRITLYPTTTQFGKYTVDCIRIRPEIPPDGPAKQRGAPAPLVDPTALGLAKARAETGLGPPVDEQAGEVPGDEDSNQEEGTDGVVE